MGEMSNKSINTWPFHFCIRSVFEYDNGILFWSLRPDNMFKSPGYARSWNSRWAGREALAKFDKDGYKSTIVFGRSFRVHRLVWMYHNDGQCPEYIDHIDGDNVNNRIENLREATKQQNGWNRGKNRNNTTGYKGVYFNKRLGKYRASVYLSGKVLHAGHYATAEEAHLAYCDKLREVSGEYFHP